MYTDNPHLRLQGVFTKSRQSQPLQKTASRLRTFICLAAAISLAACAPDLADEAETADRERRPGAVVEPSDPDGQAFDPEAASPGGMDSSQHVRFSLENQPETLAPGDSHRLVLRLEMDPDWHVMANPASMEFLIPTELRFPDTPAAMIEGPEYPEGDDFSVEALDESVKVYKETVEIPFTLRISEDASPGRHRVAGTLQVQACDDSVCLAPSTLPVEFAFRVDE